MLSENKLKNLHQFLTSKNKNSIPSKKVSLKSETTSPSSYNERNYSTQNKHFYSNNKDIQIPHYLGYKKSNTIDKNCYNNINLLDNLKTQDDICNSLSKDLNISNFSNISKISISSSLNNRNSAMYNKSLFAQIMKYYTRKSKNEIIQFEEIDFILKPMTKLINNSKNNLNNEKNLKKNIEEKNSTKIGKKDNNKNNKSIIKNKDDNYSNNIQLNQLNNNINDINSNEHRNYIGIDENFNLTFGKSSNKIEIATTNNHMNNYIHNCKNIKYKNNKNVSNNFKFNINTIRNKKSINKNDIIEINPQNHRNNNNIEPPLLISEKLIKNEIKDKKIIDNNNINKEENTPSFLNESKKEDEKINSKTSFQFKTRKFNIPTNAINIDNIKLNNHIFQNLIQHKKNILNKSKKKNENKNKKDNNENNIKEIKKKKNYSSNKEFNLNHFNRDYSGKKNYK